MQRTPPLKAINTKPHPDTLPNGDMHAGLFAQLLVESYRYLRLSLIVGLHLRKVHLTDLTRGHSRETPPTHQRIAGSPHGPLKALCTPKAGHGAALEALRDANSLVSLSKGPNVTS